MVLFVVIYKEIWLYKSTSLSLTLLFCECAYIEVHIYMSVCYVFCLCLFQCFNFVVVSKRMFVFAAVHIYVFCVCLFVCVIAQYFNLVFVSVCLFL